MSTRNTQTEALEAVVRSGAACPECGVPFPTRIRVMCSQPVPDGATWMLTITCANGCQVLPCAMQWDKP